MKVIGGEAETQSIMHIAPKLGADLRHMLASVRAAAYRYVALVSSLILPSEKGHVGFYSTLFAFMAIWGSSTRNRLSASFFFLLQTLKGYRPLNMDYLRRFSHQNRLSRMVTGNFNCNFIISRNFLSWAR